MHGTYRYKYSYTTCYSTCCMRFRFQCFYRTLHSHHFDVIQAILTINCDSTFLKYTLLLLWARFAPSQAFQSLWRKRADADRSNCCDFCQERWGNHQTPQHKHRPPTKLRNKTSPPTRLEYGHPWLRKNVSVPAALCFNIYAEGTMFLRADSECYRKRICHSIRR